MTYSPVEKFAFTSSIAADVWHQKNEPDAFEWWYFDALSDDGRDAVVIIFLDNFVFSPRYNSSKNRKLNKLNAEKNAELKRFPAVAFIYYRNGKPLYRAINEFGNDDFSAETDSPNCQIGINSFKYDFASYGSGFLISVDCNLPNKRRLIGNFEWLSIEGNFFPDKTEINGETHHWNLVSSRSDVTGSIKIEDKRGKNIDTIHFRGTGYHDHNTDSRWMPKTIKDWQWGRAHFYDSTAIFYRYSELSDNLPVTKLFVIQNGELRERNALYEEQNISRNIFGLKYPKRLRLHTKDNVSLRVKQNEVIDQSFFYLRFLSEITLTLRDGKPRKTIGITELLNPKPLNYRWLDFFINMRIGRNGRGAKIP